MKHLELKEQEKQMKEIVNKIILYQHQLQYQQLHLLQYHPQLQPLQEKARKIQTLYQTQC